MADYDATFATSPVTPARRCSRSSWRPAARGWCAAAARSPNWAAIVAAVLVLRSSGASPGSSPTAADSPATLAADQHQRPASARPVRATRRVTAARHGQVKVSVGAGDTRVVVRDRFKQIAVRGHAHRRRRRRSARASPRCG